jgi:hypothetical protein
MTADPGGGQQHPAAFEMTENMPVGMFVSEMLPDGTRQFVFVSNRLLDMLGLERDDLMRDWRAIYANIIPNGLNPDGCANAEGLREDFRFYAGMGWADGKADPDSLVDATFCKAAVAKLGPYVKAK